MEIRRYQSEDLAELVRLFGETVRTICRRDYTVGQVEAWAASEAELLQRDKWFHTLYTLVAAGEDGHLLGYGNVDDTGYLDHLFVHRDHQREGVASRICSALENHCLEGGVTCMTVHASITARPFFERRGYMVEQVQQVPLRGETLTNYRMSRRWK